MPNRQRTVSARTWKTGGLIAAGATVGLALVSLANSVDMVDGTAPANASAFGLTKPGPAATSLPEEPEPGSALSWPPRESSAVPSPQQGASPKADVPGRGDPRARGERSPDGAPLLGAPSTKPGQATPTLPPALDAPARSLRDLGTAMRPQTLRESPEPGANPAVDDTAPAVGVEDSAPSADAPLRTLPARDVSGSAVAGERGSTPVPVLRPAWTSGALEGLGTLAQGPPFAPGVLREESDGSVGGSPAAMPSPPGRALDLGDQSAAGMQAAPAVLLSPPKSRASGHPGDGLIGGTERLQPAARERRPTPRVTATDGSERGAAAADDEPSTTSSVKSEPAAAKPEPARGEQSPSEASAAKPGVVEAPAVAGAIAKPVVEKASIVEAEVAESEAVKPQAVTPEVEKAEVAKPEVAEHVAVKAEVAKPEVVEAEVAESEAVKPAVVEPEAVKPVVAKPEVVEAEVVESEAVKPVDKKASSVDPEMVERLDAKPELAMVSAGEDGPGGVQPAEGDASAEVVEAPADAPPDGAATASASIANVTSGESGQGDIADADYGIGEVVARASADAGDKSGADGPDGEAGQDGSSGAVSAVAEVPDTGGQDGADGQDGQDGADGQDGRAAPSPGVGTPAPAEASPELETDDLSATWSFDRLDGEAPNVPGSQILQPALLDG